MNTWVYYRILELTKKAVYMSSLHAVTALDDYIVIDDYTASLSIRLEKYCSQVFEKEYNQGYNY